MLKQDATVSARMMTYYYLAKQLYDMDEPAQDQRVLNLFRKEWQEMVASPWQCSWEEFAGGSKAHIYGMYPGYFLSAYVLGVRRDAPVSSKELRIEPHLANLTSAKGTVVTEYGPVQVAWERDGVGLKLAVTLPPGTKTTVALPYRAGQESIVLDGVNLKGTRQGNRLEIPIQAGVHQASY
jgi:alpha-L-rhamnosidase